MDPLPAAQPRPGRSRRNLPSDELRARILAAARVLVAEVGYDAATMEEIARVAGISRARAYRLFSSRREVMAAVMTEDARSLAGEVMLQLAQVDGLESKLHSLVRVLFEFADRRRNRHRVLYSHADPTDPDLAETLRSIRGAVARVLEHELARELPDTGGHDANLLAHGLIAMAEGCAVGWAGSPSPSVDRAIELVSRVALNTLRLEAVPATL